MKRFAGSSGHVRPVEARRQRGYTIVELLMATTLTLILMGVVATIFGAVSRSVHESRATLEMTSRLRGAKTRLQLDLEGVTVPMLPPRRPEAGEGYFEIREGPMGPWTPPYLVARDTDRPRTPPPTDPVPIPYEYDTTVTDFDDVLMFTTRSRKGPFIGRYRDTTIESEEAEVIWFVRGRTLYRRVLLVAPQRTSDLDRDLDDTSLAPTDYNGVIDSTDLTDSAGAAHAFHEWYDLSARPEVDRTGSTAGLPVRPGWGWVLNSLGDLTKRENRYAHRVHPIDGFPFPVSRWGQLGLPTLRECAHANWMTWLNAASMPGVTPQVFVDGSGNPHPYIDLWNDPHPWPEVEPVTGTLAAFQGTGVGERVAEDVILTNVIGFDVKVWDPSAPVLRSIRGDNGTPADLTDDPTNDGVLVVPGDPGYPNALAHFWVALANPPASRNRYHLPPGSDWNNPDPRVGAWGAYVDLNYAAYAATTYAPLGVVPTYQSDFSGPNHPRSGLTLAPVYDTWSLHYESNASWIDLNDNGVFDPGEQFGDEDGDGLVDEGTDGFDNGNGMDDDGDGLIDEDGLNGRDDDGDGQIDEDDALKNGIVDDVTEMETSPPYPVPLRGIQVEIRTFEPDSRQVRTVTLVMDFVTK